MTGATAPAAAPRPGPRFAQVGVILFVEQYDACIAFYRDAVGLPVIGATDELTILGFGTGYLEIERGGMAAAGKPRDRNPTVLRFDVDDLDAAATTLRDRGIAIERRDFDWGRIAMFVDPDGNRCELKAHDAAQTVARP